MRVGFIIRGDLERLSGGFLYDRKIVEYLRSHGDEVQVLSLPWETLWGRTALRDLPTLFRRLAALSADIVVQDELAHPFLFLLNPKLKEKWKIPVVGIIHHLKCCEKNSAWRKCFHRFAERRYLHTLDGFIFNSRTTEKTVAALSGRASPGVIAYPGGDRLAGGVKAEFLSRRSRADKVRIVFVGNVIPRKELHTLISGLSLAGGSGWELVIAGNFQVDPSYLRRVKHQVETAGLQGRVGFTGQVSDAELADLLSRSHLLAVPSSYEGFGIVYLEAMSFGLPVIAAAEGGAGEIVTHGRNGFLVKPGNSRALADHLRELLGDRNRLLAMALAALERFHTFPPWEEGCGKVYRFLHQCRGN